MYLTPNIIVITLEKKGPEVYCDNQIPVKIKMFLHLWPQFSNIYVHNDRRKEENINCETYEKDLEQTQGPHIFFFALLVGNLLLLLP